MILTQRSIKGVFGLFGALVFDFISIGHVRVVSASFHTPSQQSYTVQQQRVKIAQDIIFWATYWIDLNVLATPLLLLSSASKRSRRHTACVQPSQAMRSADWLHHLPDHKWRQANNCSLFALVSATFVRASLFDARTISFSQSRWHNLICQPFARIDISHENKRAETNPSPLQIQLEVLLELRRAVKLSKSRLYLVLF